MLRIRQYIDPLAINRTAKAVLTEVCELVENGRLGYCNAQNAHFVSRLAGSERTITRALTALVQLGLVTIKGQGKARRITPTPALRAYYTATTAPARRVAADALNLASEPSQIGEVAKNLNLDKSGAEPRQKWSTNLDKTGRQPRQKWQAPYKEYEQYEQKTSTTKHALNARERAQLEKRIATLEHEKAALERETVRLQQLLVAQPPGAPAAAALHTQPVSPSMGVAAPALEFEKFWESYGKKVDTKRCRLAWQKLTPAQHQTVLAHVPGYVRANPDPKYRKNPLTYLNGENWQDEPPAAHTKLAAAVPVGSSYDKDKARATNQQLAF